MTKNLCTLNGVLNSYKFCLNEHERFCKEAVDVLKCAINEINNHTVDELICVRLRRLFESCKVQHNKLEDTYSRVNYEQTVT